MFYPMNIMFSHNEPDVQLATRLVPWILLGDWTMRVGRLVGLQHSSVIISVYLVVIVFGQIRRNH